MDAACGSDDGEGEVMLWLVTPCGLVVDTLMQ